MLFHHKFPATTWIFVRLEDLLVSTALVSLGLSATGMYRTGIANQRLFTEDYGT